MSQCQRFIGYFMHESGRVCVCNLVPMHTQHVCVSSVVQSHPGGGGRSAWCSPIPVNPSPVFEMIIRIFFRMFTFIFVGFYPSLVVSLEEGQFGPHSSHTRLAKATRCYFIIFPTKELFFQISTSVPIFGHSSVCGN